MKRNFMQPRNNMKIITTNNKTKLKMSHKEWTNIGKETGWMKKSAQVVPNDGYADGGEPYTEEEMVHMNEPEALSFSFGATPPNIIDERVAKQTPNGYPMTIKSQTEWSIIAEVVNIGIDAHLEGFTKSKFNNGDVVIHPSEMNLFLRRLYDNGKEEAWSLRSDILTTLGIEEI